MNMLHRYALKVVSRIPELTKKTKVFRGPGCELRFIRDLYQEFEEVKQYFESDIGLVMTQDFERVYQLSTVCGICDHKLDWSSSDLNKQPVRHHDHFTGQFICAAHSLCNLKTSKPKFIPIVFHGLKNYDCKHILKALHKFDSNIEVIANSSEKFSQIKTKQFTFVDSLAHLAGTSLENLVGNLREKGEDNFKNLKEEFPEREKFLTCLGKGLYPYEFVDSFEVFDMPIPPRQNFYSSLTDSLPTKEAYQHLQYQCKLFNLKTVGDLHDFYVKLDVILLADCIESYRKLCHSEYGLDPMWFPTEPSVAWNSMLKYTQVQLELIQCPEMHCMISKGIRGGINQISHRASFANNPHVPNYDPSKPISSILYADCNSLYPWALQNMLPHKDYRWLAENEIAQLNVETYPSEGIKGLILEVDIDYPDELHDLHSDYPLAVDKLCITKDMLSPYATDFLENHSFKYSNQTRLTSNLFAKHNYVVHIKNLQFYLEHGLKLIRIRRVVEFTQSTWMKPFIDLNVKKRGESKSEFESEYFKLQMNSCFGNIKLFGLNILYIIILYINILYITIAFTDIDFIILVILKH